MVEILRCFFYLSLWVCNRLFLFFKKSIDWWIIIDFYDDEKDEFYIFI